MNCRYELFPLESVEALLPLLQSKPNLRGLNVTIPYKQAVIPYLDDLDRQTAARIGAVNTIKRYEDGSTKGYNTDYYGFKTSLEEWLERRGESCKDLKALVLGNGGAAKAVTTALDDLQTDYRVVSRTPREHELAYGDLTLDILSDFRLLINTTPLGMSPNLDSCPPIPYTFISNKHLLYDLVYNPAETTFLKKGAQQGAATMNGLNMLYLQAEKSWSIWNEADREE